MYNTAAIIYDTIGYKKNKKCYRDPKNKRHTIPKHDKKVDIYYYFVLVSSKYPWFLLFFLNMNEIISNKLFKHQDGLNIFLTIFFLDSAHRITPNILSDLLELNL